ncbi:MAG: MarR family transcriptional regulator [Sulfobacillus acidophilus]|uniref:MarR family transcriptional regulator n=1 Tax=Sulfobacillus acidophilus TaxID=53633 RepID=A0A2T2WDA9_9FIRM|nr:MAG: MarR family transcriptional regulator [Sulfobacillus acidophilus]
MPDASNRVLAFIGIQDALAGHYAKLSRPKLRLMVKLEQGPVSISELAERLHISSPAVSQMVDKLCSDGYVKRESQADDQRIVTVRLTDMGQEVLQESLAEFSSRVNELLSPLTDAQSQCLLTLLNTVLQLPDTGSGLNEFQKTARNMDDDTLQAENS